MSGDRISTFVTLIGKVSILSDRDAVKAVYLPSDNLPMADSGTHPVMEEAAAEISEYLSGGRKTFDVPVSQTGTEFQEEVWETLLRIPYGSTETYGRVAAALGRPGAARAVGAACGANRIPMIIPCHRVVSASGLGGYAGGAALKQRLLSMERDFL